MATAPVAYQSALIESLRGASPGFTSNNPGVTMLANPANSSLMINFLRGPRTGLANNPQAFTWPTFSPPPATPAPPPAAGPTPSPPPSGGGGPIVVGPGPDVGPVTPLPQVPDDGFVGPPAPGPSPDDDFVGPPAPGIIEVDPPSPPAPSPDDEFVGPPAPGIIEVDPPAPPAPDDDFVGPMPDDFVGPPAPDEDVAQPLPVPDPAPPDVVDLPPLPPGSDDDFVGPMPDDFVGPMPDDFVGPMPDDFVGPMPDDFVGPMPDDFVGPPAPPEYDEIPEGEIEIGPPGDSQPARDVIDQIGDITEVGDPLDELGDIDLPDPVIELPPFVPPSNDDFVGPMPFFPSEDDFVGPMPDDFVGPPAPDYDEIPEGEIEVGPPGSSQPARDAIDEIGDITEVGDPLDELGEIELPEPVIEPPLIPPVGGDDFVGPMPYFPSEDDFVGPMPDDFVGPPAPEYDEIPEGEIDVVAPGSSQPARDAINEIGDITEVGDPLDELGDVDLLEPVIEPPFIPPAGGDDFVGPMPYIPSDDDFVGPMPDDFVGPPAPEYDEIPEGEIDVVAPGSSQPARDAIDRIGDITEVGDPLDELGDLELSDFVIDPPSVPSAGDDFVGPMPDDFVGPMPNDFVGPMPDDFMDTPATDGFDAGAFNEGPTLEQRLPSGWGDFSAADKIDWFNENNVSIGELQAAGVPDSEIQWMQENGYEVAAGNVPDYTNDLWGPDAGGDVTPDYTNDLWGPEESALTNQDYFEMALFDLMAQELLTGGGGSGRPGNNMNILAYE